MIGQRALFSAVAHITGKQLCRPSHCSALLLSHLGTAQNASHLTCPSNFLSPLVVTTSSVAIQLQLRHIPSSLNSDCSMSQHLETIWHFPISDRFNCYCSIAPASAPDDVAPQFRPFSYDSTLDIAEQFRDNNMPGLLKGPPSSQPSRESSRDSSPDFGLALPPALQRPPSPHLLDISEEDFMDEPVPIPAPPTPPPRRQVIRQRRPRSPQLNDPPPPAAASPARTLHTPPLQMPARTSPPQSAAPQVGPRRASPALPASNLRTPSPQDSAAAGPNANTGDVPLPSASGLDSYTPRRQLFPIVTLERLPSRVTQPRSPDRSRSPLSDSSSPPPLQIDTSSPTPSPAVSPSQPAQATPEEPPPGPSQPRPVVFLPLQTDLPTAMQAARDAVPVRRSSTSDEDPPGVQPGNPQVSPDLAPAPSGTDRPTTPAATSSSRQRPHPRSRPSTNIPADVQRATDLHASFRNRLRQRISPMHAFIPLSPGSPSLMSRVRPGCPPIHTRMTPAHQVAIRDTPPATSLDMSEELEWAANLDYFFLLSATVQDYVIWRNNIVNLAQRRRWSAPFLVIVVTLSLRRMLPSFTLQMIGITPNPSGFAFIAALDNFFISIRPNIPGERHPGRTSASIYMGPPVPNVPVATLTGLQTRWIFRYRALPPASSFQRAHILLSYPPTQRELYLLTIRNFLHSVHNMVLNCFTPDSPSVARVAFPLQPAPLLPPPQPQQQERNTSASTRSSSSDSEPPPLASTSSSDSTATSNSGTHRHVQYVDDVLTLAAPNTPPQPLVSPIFATACISALTSWAFVFILRAIRNFSQQ